MNHIIDTVIETANFILISAFNHRDFIALLKAVEKECCEKIC
jgi:hypothetical protein